MIDERMIQQATEDLYSAALRRVPDDTKAALARDSESDKNARATLDLMLKGAIAAETNDTFVCSDSNVPVYRVEIGGQAQWRGDIKAAITCGFAHLVEVIRPPLPLAMSNAFIILSAAIRELLQVEWRSFPAHFRLSRMRAADFGPLTVGIDAHGNSIYERLAQGALERRSAILERMDERRAAATRPFPISGRIT